MIEVDVEKKFAGFHCQVQTNNNEEVEEEVEKREGSLALTVESMPDGFPIVMVAIEHANGTSNVAVLDHTGFMKLVVMMTRASHEAAAMAARAAKVTVQ